MIALRKTALTLHAMSATDQAWFLERLPALHRQSLMGMLEELVSLGISGDPVFVTQLLAEVQTPSEGQTLKACSAQSFWYALEREPVSVQSTSLQALAKRDRDAVLACVPAAKRLALTQALATSSPWSERLRLAVVGQVLRTAQASEGGRPS